MTIFSNFQYNNAWAFASASSSSSSAYAQAGAGQMTQNAGCGLQGMGLLFAGMDLIDDGALNGSIFQSLLGQQAQSPVQQYQPYQQNQQQFMPPPLPPPPPQMQNPMMQMMQMMMQFFMMMMQMLGMGQQNQQTQQQQAYNPYGNTATNANSASAAAAASANGASASAAASANGANAFAFAFAMAMAGSGEQTEIGTEGRGEWGDPHYEFKGADGKMINFDHKGKDGHTYNIFNGDNLKINGKYVPASNPNAPQVVGEATIQAGGDTITYSKDGKCKINGQEVKDGTYQLQDGTKVDVKGANVTVHSNENDACVKLTNSGGSCVNIDPEGKFGNLGGILGTAIKENRKLSNEEAEKFDVTNQQQNPNRPPMNPMMNPIMMFMMMIMQMFMGMFGQQQNQNYYQL